MLPTNSLQLQVLSLKVHQQTNLAFASLEIVEALRDVQGRQRFDAFQLDQNSVFNDHVHDIVANIFAFLGHLQRHLSHSSQSSNAQFRHQRSLVDLLKKPGTENIRDFVKSPNNISSQFIAFCVRVYRLHRWLKVFPALVFAFSF